MILRYHHFNLVFLDAIIISNQTNIQKLKKFLIQLRIQALRAITVHNYNSIGLSVTAHSKGCGFSSRLWFHSFFPIRSTCIASTLYNRRAAFGEVPNGSGNPAFGRGCVRTMTWRGASSSRQGRLANTGEQVSRLEVVSWVKG